MTAMFSPCFAGRGVIVRTCSWGTPRPLTISSSFPSAAESCPPVIPTVRLSSMTTQIASRSPVIPECVNVESPMTATGYGSPASAAPFAIVMDAPMSTQDVMAL